MQNDHFSGRENAFLPAGMSYRNYIFRIYSILMKASERKSPSSKNISMVLYLCSVAANSILSWREESSPIGHSEKRTSGKEEATQLLYI